jgi:elongation factor G
MKKYKTELLRNVGLFSHGGAGKTSLAEAMLFDSKAITRLGRVEEGTTTSDYDPDEIKRHISVSTSLAPCEWRESKINVIDTPGYSDFVGEMKAAMRVVDTAIIVLSAQAGVEVGSEQVWAQAEAANTPRLVFINKMERENASFHKTLDQAREILSNLITPLQLPVGNQSDFEGMVDLMRMKAYIFSKKGDAKFEEKEIPAALQAEAGTLREQLVERIAESDDELLEKYLEGEELSTEQLAAALRKGILSGSIIPTLCGSATANIGIQPLMDAIVDYLPSPADLGTVEATDPVSGAQVQLEPISAAPLAALVFKTLADPYVGKLTYLRIYSGSLRSDSRVLNASRNKEERIGQVYFMRGKEQQPTDEVGTGDIGVVAKLQETVTGETLCDPDRPVVLTGIEFPEPSFTAAILPKTKGDLDKLGPSLARIAEEDPTIRIGKDPLTGETIVSGTGESHVQIVAERMHRKFGVDVTVGLPKVPYRETIGASAKAEYKHKKQTGGHGQYGHVFLDLEPLTDGTEFEFQEKIVGGVVPRQYIPAVEKGVREALGEGLLAGYPVFGVRVTLTDGSYHTVDSSEMAFKIAASQAFKKGALSANPTILEPIVDLSITVPESYMGDVIGDLNSKRARVSGMTPDGNGMTTIQAQAPLSEVQRYASDLRSITQGRGTFKMEFSHYEEVPPHVKANIIEAAKAAKAQS